MFPFKPTEIIHNLVQVHLLDFVMYFLYIVVIIIINILVFSAVQNLFVHIWCAAVGSWYTTQFWHA